MAKVTRTLGPIHFEDLEPHRFEDLVRELIYDFKPWQDIEATGRGGSDDGFDVRAWEAIEQTENNVDEEEEKEEEPKYPMEGNLWMIQCKREKEIGPKKVVDIIKDGVDEKNPPYGYILVAPADFSKKSFDAFREELRKRGVMEFHLWGKGALEDMLHMPKNDRILFTFFGISLSVRQRSRKTEIRFAMNNKNKLLRVIGGGSHSQSLHEPVLVRDFSDENYPFKGEYKDFKKHPRWREHIAVSLHPLGLMLQTRNFYAYIDKDKKEFDFVGSDDLLNRKSERNDKEIDYKKRQLISDFWRHLPRKNQAYLEVRAILLFQDMLIIDDKGDIAHDFPHIYADYKYKKSPFKARWHYLKLEHDFIDVFEEGYKKVNYFPKEFPEPQKGKAYTDKLIEPDENDAIMFKNGNVKTLYSVDGKYDFLERGDKIQVKGTETAASYRVSAEPMKGIEVMCKYEVLVKDYFKNTIPYYRESIEKQVGRKLKNSEKLLILEIESAGYWEFPQPEDDTQSSG